MAIGRKSPLQRLGDQRKRLALVALAAGALAAAALRRRKGQEETEFGKAVPIPQAPEPVAVSESVESGPPAEVSVPSAASEADVPHAPSAAEPEASPSTETEASTEADDAASIDASAPEPAPAEPAAEDQSAASGVEPATGELNAEEASILAVLAQSGRLDDDRTAIAVATSLERETTDVAAVLRKLSAEGVVSGDLYTAVGDKIWAVTERGVRRLGAQS